QERIDAAMTRSQQVGIPLSLLESKIAEGRAKGVAMDRIAMAVESRLRNLEQAKIVMARAVKEVDAAQISVGAHAIGAGVDECVPASVKPCSKISHPPPAVIVGLWRSLC